MSHLSQIAYQDDEEENFMLSQEYALLFPLRNGPLPPITQQTNVLLYEALKCKLCQQLMQTPVYLKCSHRFCRPCIERYIRSMNKKGCPICLAPLLSKRELRPCDFTMDLIDMAFGKVKINRNTDVEGDVDSDQPPQELFRPKRTYRRRQESLETKAMGRRSRKRIFRNTGQQEVDTQNLKGSTYISSLSHENQSDKSKESGSVTGQQEVKEENIDEIKMEEVFFGQKKPNRQSFFQNCLINYRENSLQLPANLLTHEQSSENSCQEIFIKIKLEPLANSPLTPFLDLQQIECPLYSNVQLVVNLITQELNMDSNLLTLYTIKEDRLLILDAKTLLFSVNEQCWSSAGQLSQFDFQIALGYLTLDKYQDNGPKAMSSICVIYYSASFGGQSQKKQYISPTKHSPN